MLIAQMEENRRLSDRLEQAEAELNDRRIRIEESGSIAEAALRLNDVFKQAEASAELYLENIKRLETEASEKAEKLLRDAETESRRMIERAEKVFGTAEKLREAADWEEKEYDFSEQTVQNEEDEKKEQEDD